MEPWLH